MELVRLALFVTATTYLPGRALRRSVHPAAQTALGLSLSLIACALPASFATWALAIIAVAIGLFPVGRQEVSPAAVQVAAEVSQNDLYRIYPRSRPRPQFVVR